MVFNSINFLIFFPIVTIVYFILPHRFRLIWLLFSSYFFYANLNIIFVIIMFAATVVSYIGGVLLGRIKIDRKNKNSKASKSRRYIAAVTILFSVSVLFFFKYFYFAIDILNSIFNPFGIIIKEPAFTIVLPIGISFYTFQIIAYILDVYNGTSKSENNFIKYALFISFFPKLLIGPIERTNTLLPQLQEEHKFSYDNLKYGLQLMLYGYFLKLVIADRAGILVRNVFENYESYGGLEIVVAILIYGIQNYTDFFGYTMMATGVAQTMGFKLMQNFNHPFFAVSVADFWRRWHLSISSWIRSYIYMPLVLSGPITKLRYFVSITLSFLVSGIWHGANWTFIVWGLYHGLCIALAEIFKPFFNKIYSIFNVNVECFSYRLMQMTVTLALVSFSRLIFIAPDLSTAFAYIERMFSIWNPWIFFDNSLYDMGLDRKDFWVLCFSIFILWTVSFMQERGIKIRETIAKQNFIFRLLIYNIVILIILVFGIYGPGYDAAQFIYFRF